MIAFLITFFIACFKCNRSISGDTKELFAHLSLVHGINSASTYFRCCENGCNRTFNYLWSYKRHILKEHICDTAPSITDNLHTQHILAQSPSENMNTSTTLDSVADEETENWDDLAEEDITYRVACFLAKLKAQSNQTYSAINYMVKHTSTLITDIVRSLQTKTMALLDRLGHSDQADVSTLNNHFERAAEPLMNLDSDYKQMKYFSETGFFIKPETQQFPGISYVQRLDASTGSVKQIAVQDTFQYVPLKPLLKKILESPGTMEKVLAHKQNQEGALIDYIDGDLYKSSHLFSEEFSIPLVLYNDDCETVNPIGSKTAIHKLGLIYFQIRCLPPELLSSLSACFLLAVYKSDDVKTYGMDSVLQCIVEDLKDLEQNGFQVETEQFCGTVKVGVAQVCGDNLALNSLLGFSESFAANSVCRVCKIHKLCLHTQTAENPDLLRNAVNYNQDLQINNPAETGLKRRCVLDELAFFSVVQNVTPDIMHDILEGVGPLEVKLVLSKLIAEGHITLDTLNYRLTSFDYGFVDRCNKPSVLSSQELKNPSTTMRQTAAQMWCLLRFLPLLIGDLIPHDNKHWELLLLLLSCMEMIFSPSLTPDTTIYLRCLIQDHHTLFQELFPHLHLKPKHHFMVHYPSAFRKIGPLINFWSMRYEAKHSFFKRLSHVTCNFKNVTKTMTYRHQMMLCFQLLTGRLFKKETEIGPGQNSVLQSVENVQDVTGGLEDFPLSSNVYVPAWVKVNGTVYRPGMTVFMTCTTDGDPQFGRIKKIVTLDDSVKLLVQRWTTVSFSHHYFAYSVVPDQELEALSVNELHDFHPLHAVKSFDCDDDHYYIPLRYRRF